MENSTVDQKTDFEFMNSCLQSVLNVSRILNQGPSKRPERKTKTHLTRHYEKGFTKTQKSLAIT